MISFSVGAFDVLRASVLNDLDEKIQRARARKKEGEECFFGVGVYTDSYIRERGMDDPLKSVEDRMAIVRQLRGVDFVFPVNAPIDSEETTAEVRKAFTEYKKRKDAEAKQVDSESKPQKKYEIGYAPGTYDLFHMGHLENLMIAAEQCEKLFVGVKADSLVREHKGRPTTILEDERMEIIRHFKFVAGVHKYYTRDPHVAGEYIKMKTGRNVDAIFAGSDLKGHFDQYANDFNIVYTERKPEVMETRSTTAYKERLRNRAKDIGENRRFTLNHPLQERTIEENPTPVQASMFQEDGSLKTYNDDGVMDFE